MSVRVGAKVEVVGKGVFGTVAYIGTTLFSSGIITATYLSREYSRDAVHVDIFAALG